MFFRRLSQVLGGWWNRAVRRNGISENRIPARAAEIARSLDQGHEPVTGSGLGTADPPPVAPHECIGTETEHVSMTASTERDPELGGSVNRHDAGADRTNRRRPRRSQKYERIDEELRKIALARPNTQEEVFEALQARRVVWPSAEPFATHGWVAGFRRDEAAARSWLSKRWSELDLPPLPQGPKSKTK